MELIDKNKLLEDIKKLKQNLSASPIVVIEDVESLVESLEVKEVDLSNSFDATVCKFGSIYLKEMDRDAIAKALEPYKDGDKVKVIIKSQKEKKIIMNKESKLNLNAGDYAISHCDSDKTYNGLEVHKMLCDAYIAGNNDTLESEDEKVRKEIVGFLDMFLGTHITPTATPKQLKGWIAWLENVPVTIDNEKREGFHLGYKACLEKQGEQNQKHFELKAGHWYICHRAYCCRSDHLTVKEGERFMCEKDGIVKGFVIKEPEKYFKEVCAPAPYEDEQDTTQFEYIGSDDVRRQSIIQVLEYARSLDTYNQYGKADIDKNIVWLKRQAEHANFLSKIQVGDKVTRNEDGVLVNLSQLKRVAKPSEKQGEKKASCTTIVETGNGGINALVTLPIEMKTAEERLGIDSDTYNKIVDECIFGEQKSEENKGNIGGISPTWSEEDSQYVEDAIALIGFGFSAHTIGEVQEWLHSLQDRVQPQPKQEWKQENTGDLTAFENAMMHIGGSFFGQHAGLDPNDTNSIKEQANLLLELVPSKEWSEEDKDFMYDTLSNLTELKDRYGEGYGNVGKCIVWLKSLRSQNRWKPNDEQMNNK